MIRVIAQIRGLWHNQTSPAPRRCRGATWEDLLCTIPWAHAAGVALLLGAAPVDSAQVGAAGTVTFEWGEGGAGNGVSSPPVSLHNIAGPCADRRLTSAVSGLVDSVESVES